MMSLKSMMGLVLALSVGARAASLAVGDAIGVDFGPVANDNHFNVLAHGAQKFVAGNRLSETNGSLVTLSGTTLDGVAVILNATGYFANDDADPGLGAPPAVYRAENLTDWIGVVTAKGGSLTITFTGLDDTLAYDLNIGTAFDQSKSVNGTVYRAGEQSATNRDTASAPNFFDLKGLSTDGRGKLVITVSDAAASAVSALTLTAVPVSGAVPSSPKGYAEAGKPVLISERRAAEVAGSRPNVVIILTDDQGYADLSCFGGNHVFTPNIDKMAAEGARLTSFYVAAPLCTPSRAALMTGCYPARIDMDVPSSIAVDVPNAKGRRFPVCLAGDGKGLNPKELTIAEVAQSAGYKTGMFGKWHLGDQPEFLPPRQGFEEFFGLPYSHDICPTHPRQKVFQFPPLPLMEGETVIELDPNDDYLTRRITERAVQFIRKNKAEPFFLYVAHALPHGPLAASPEIKQEYAPIAAKDKTKKGIYSTAVYELDWSVGEILKTLKEEGLDENTLVLFTSDNGPTRGSAKPLSGKKGCTLEGGQRVPAVIRWPGVIPAGSDTDKVLSAMDVFPTFATLSGATLPTDLVIDGKDMLPVLLEGAESPHEYFFYAHWGELEGVRWKSWKLRVIDGKEVLCNLDEDIGEKKNVAGNHPEIVQQLKAAMQGFEKDLGANVRPAGSVENPVPLTK
jgi:arylsulfatase A-like enzyme